MRPGSLAPRGGAAAATRAGGSSSCRNSRCSFLCVPDVPGPRPSSSSARRTACTASSWPLDDGVEFHLGHGDWIDVLSAGFEVERLVELYAPENARTHAFYDDRDRRVGEQVAGRGAVGSRASPPDARLHLSPQRRAILEQLRIPFEVVAPTYVEHDPPGLEPVELVRAHAEGKARSVREERRVTLGVDTTVALDGRVYGKPADAEDARGCCASSRDERTPSCPGSASSARSWTSSTHEVDRGDVPSALGSAADAYLESGEWEGRAGAYAIQGLGGRLVERIDGDYLNVVGLPGALLVSLLERHAPNLLEIA